MLTLSAKIRKEFGKKVKILRGEDILPGILYGPKIKNLPLEINLKEFQKIYKEAGESSIIKLEVKNQNSKTEEFLTLIKEINRDSLTNTPIHVDFYQPNLKEKIEAKVPLIFEGNAPAVRDLGGTLIKNISEVEIKALPQNLPKEIKVNVENLKTFEDSILIKDLKTPEGTEILKESKKIVAQVLPPEKVEEELEKPIEEKMEEVEKVEKKEKKEELSTAEDIRGKKEKQEKEEKKEE